jgi:hypothetical protein
VWPQWRDLVLPPATIHDIGDDGIYRMSSNSIFIYSPVHTGSLDQLFKKLNLRSDRKLLVAFTSSLDEIAANNHYLESVGLEPFPEKQPFRDQIEWLHALIERVEPSSDLQLVIRVHPREGANRRDPLQSTHLGLLRQQFSRPYENVRVVWPEDPVSSYDLMEMADVGLSAWSITGLEMARLGVPTVVAFDLHTPFPIGDVVRWKETCQGYFECLDQALQAGPSLDQIRFAYRWSYLRFLGCSFNLDDLVPDPEFGALPPYRTPRAAAHIESVLIDGRSALDVNRDALLVNQGPEADAVELDALMHQLRRSIWYLCFGDDRVGDYRLFYSRSPLDSMPEGYDAAIIDDGQGIELRAASRNVRRRSHMVRRLGKLAAANHAERVQ